MGVFWKTEKQNVKHPLLRMLSTSAYWHFHFDKLSATPLEEKVLKHVYKSEKHYFTENVSSRVSSKKAGYDCGNLLYFSSSLFSAFI